jgi:Flp pilus assembly protein TadD
MRPEVNSKDVVNLQEVAKVYESQENFDGAINCYQKILNLQPKNVACYLTLAKALKQNNQIIEAIAAYQKAIEIKPTIHFRTYIELGEVLESIGEIEEAIFAYQKAIEVNANSHILLYRKLALLLEKQERLDEAIAIYELAINREPNKYDFYASLGKIQIKKGELDRGIANYQKALELQEEAPLWLYISLRNLLAEQGRTEELRTINHQFKKRQVQEGQVIEGKNGWLFLDKDSNQIMNQVTGKLSFSPQQILHWKTLLEMRSIWLSERQIHYCFFVVPNKICVYPEFLPSISLSKNRTIMHLKNYLEEKSFVKIIYPLEELVKAKSEMDVYSKDDTHWNDFGAFIGYQKLCEGISKILDINLISRSSVEFIETVSDLNELEDESDLGSKIGQIKPQRIRARLRSQKAKCAYNNKAFNRGNLMVFENRDRTLPKAVIFRDSFSTLLLPFLSESFSRLVAVWQPNLDYSIIEKEKPDIVISQQVERFLMKIPDDLNGKTNEEYVKLKNQL